VAGGRSNPVIETARDGPDRPEQDVGQGFSPADRP
jgi:hypothetical protein